jgi:hypothetical protein
VFDISDGIVIPLGKVEVITDGTVVGVHEHLHCRRICVGNCYGIRVCCSRLNALLLLLILWLHHLIHNTDAHESGVE